MSQHNPERCPLCGGPLRGVAALPQSLGADCRRFVCCATRQNSEAGRRPPRLTAETTESLCSEHGNTSIPENIERFLVFVRNRCPRPGGTVEIDEARDFTVIDALDSDEFRFIMDCADKRQLVTKNGAKYRFDSCEGWARLMGPGGGWLRSGMRSSRST